MTKQRKEILDFIRGEGGASNTYSLQRAGLCKTNAVLHKMVEAGMLVNVYAQQTPKRELEWKNIDKIKKSYRKKVEGGIKSTRQSSFWVLGK